MLVMDVFTRRIVSRGFDWRASRSSELPQAAPVLTRPLAALNVASDASDMNLPGWGLHPLKRKLANHWSGSVSGNWRLTFTFNDGDVELVDYQDYH